MNKNTIIIAVLLILMACTNTKSISYESSTRQSKESEYVMEIFDSSNIDREYKVIGEISIKAGKITSTKKIMKTLIDRAKKMGADAVIDLRTSSIGGGSYDGSTATYSGDAKQLWKAKVIVWN